MDTPKIADMVQAMIMTEVVKSLNNAPDAVEKLVQAALTKPVGTDGKFDGYGTKMPYLDYLVGQEIRMATQGAVRAVIQERIPLIQEMIRKGLAAESLVDAVTKAVVGSASQEWRIDVSFKADKP